MLSGKARVNKDVLPTLADIYWELNDFDNASKYLNLVDTPIKYYGLSLIYADWDMRHFDIYKSYDNLKKLSVIEGVDDGLRQRVEAQLEELAALANTMAYDEMRANNLEYALNYINLAIEIKPKEANFYDSKAEILYYFGETEKALEMWRKVIGLDPDFLDKYNSTVYYQLKRDCLIEL